jgi:hypothetical protein
MKVSPAIGLTLLIGLPVGCARKGTPEGADSPAAAQRHFEVTGGFSFVPPEGWEILDTPDQKYKAVRGPSGNGFAPNIDVSDISFNGALEDTVRRSMTIFEKQMKSCRILKQEVFKTTGGLQGVRVIVEDEPRGRLLRQTFFFFPKESTAILITCSALAENGDKLDAVFADSMKTFRFEKQ